MAPLRHGSPVGMYWQYAPLPFPPQAVAPYVHQGLKLVPPSLNRYASLNEPTTVVALPVHELNVVPVQLT